GICLTAEPRRPLGSSCPRFNRLNCFMVDRVLLTVPCRSGLLRQRRGVVDLHRGVGRSGGQSVAIGAEGDYSNVGRVSLEGELFLAGLGLPQLQRARVRSEPAGQAFAVRAEDYSARCALEREEFLAGLGIPHFPSADQAFAVRAEDQATPSRATPYTPYLVGE